MGSRYLAVLLGREPLVVHGFWIHVLRYWVVHLIVGCVLLVVGLFWGKLFLTDARLDEVYTKTTTALDSLYTSGLEITFSPTSGVATNMSGPVIWSIDQIYTAFGSPRSEASLAGPQNALVIDPTASVENFASYQTFALLTRTHLVMQSSSELKIVPLLDSNATTSGASMGSGLLITKTFLQEVFVQGDDWLATNGSQIRRTFMLIGGIGGLIALPFVAFFMVMWLSLGLFLIVGICRLVSKIWVRLSYRELFTRVSLTYLPVYILLKIVFRTALLPSSPLIGYLGMVACAAIYIIRLEEKKNTPVAY